MERERLERFIRGKERGEKRKQEKELQGNQTMLLTETGTSLVTHKTVGDIERDRQSRVDVTSQVTSSCRKSIQVNIIGVALFVGKE